MARYPRPRIVTPRVKREEFAGLVKRERKRRVPRWEPPEPGEYQLLGEVTSTGMEDIGTALAESGVMSKIEDLPTGTRIRVTLRGVYRGEEIEIPAFEIDLGVGIAGPEDAMAHTHHLLFHMIRSLAAATQGEEKGYKLVDFEGEVTWIVEAVG